MHPCSLGYGRRFGIWMQGCDLACAGCCSRDTWRTGSRHEVEWNFFAPMLEVALRGRALDGVTISGGEPFQQREALAALVREIREIEARIGAEWDVMLYTGYAFEAVSGEFEILDRVDLVVAGPYDAALPMEALRGSSNQTLHRLSERARTRYSDAWLAGPGMAASMDVAMPGNDLIIAGIAARGDYAQFEEALAARGVTFKGHSWPGASARRRANT